MNKSEIHSECIHSDDQSMYILVYAMLAVWLVMGVASFVLISFYF